MIKMVSDIFQSCKKGNLQDITCYIDEGRDLNAKERGYNKKTLLHIASMYGHLDIVKILVSKGVDIESRTRTDETPLILASCNENIDVVEYLLNNDADLENENNYGDTAFNCVIKNRKMKAAKYLESKNADINHKNSFGNTPLMTAFSRGFSEEGIFLYDKLIEKSIEFDKNLLITEVIKYSRVDCMKELIKKGLEVFCQDLNYAIRLRDIYMIDLLLNFIKPENKNLIRAIEHNLDEEIVVKFLEKGCDNNIGLYFASKNNLYEVVDYCLKNDADPNYHYEFGITPFMQACKNCSGDIMELFLDRDIDLNLQDCDGNTCLMHAVTGDNSAALDYLEEADFDIKNNEGLTAEDIAYERCDKEVLSFFRFLNK